MRTRGKTRSFCRGQNGALSGTLFQHSRLDIFFHIFKLKKNYAASVFGTLSIGTDLNLSSIILIEYNTRIDHLQLSADSLIVFMCIL